MTRSLRTPTRAAIAIAALIGLAACGKKQPAPETSAPVAPVAAQAAPAAAAKDASSATQGAAQADPGNPQAAKDPAFNMPAQPVLDVSASKAELDKIQADILK